MKKHIFLILNFKSYNYTLKCVKSILVVEGNFDILIVDNDLESDSFKKLKEKFKSNNKVEVIQTKKNLGFANGNNFGYRYIQKNYVDFDFIHCINSDTQLIQKNTLKLTEEFFNKNKFYLMGPNVLTAGNETSPIGTISSIKEFRKYNRKLKFHSYIYYVIALFFQPIMGTRIERIFNTNTSKKVQKKLNNEGTIPLLSGCYLVYSKLFIDKYDFLFSDITFLYNEESILNYLLIKDGVRQIFFNKDISIIHDHAGATKTNNRKKAKIILGNLKKIKKI